MDPITQQTALATAGGKKDSVYVDDVFSTFLYDGNGGARSITNGIDLAGEGGLVWFKARNANQGHYLIDTERGHAKGLLSNGNGAEFDLTNGLAAFENDGFSTNAGSSQTINASSYEYATWTFRKAPGFFDVVTWTGDGTTKEIPHNLGSTPGFVMAKKLSQSGSWYCEHIDTTPKQIKLNETGGEGHYLSNSILGASNPATHIRADDGSLSSTGQTYIAYIFANNDQQFGTGGNESIIKCGSYTGSTSSSIDVDLGFEPQFVMIKRATGSTNIYSNWAIFDNIRGIPTGSNDTVLAANLSAAEGDDPPATGDFLSLTATGFTVDPNVNRYGLVNGNASSDYIYVAIRRSHKPPTAATEVFDLRQSTSDYGGFQTSTSVFTDLVVLFNNPTSGAISKYWVSRNTKAYLLTSTAQETAVGNTYKMDQNTGFTRDTLLGSMTAIEYSFRRAAGFFDVVNYLGTGSAQTLNHSLGAVPELMIAKSRGSGGWIVYSAATGNTKSTFLSSDDAFGNSPTDWNNTTPTATQLTIGSNLSTSGHSFIAFLFATLAGISKVGSYTGTGNDIDVDCGFTAGARFVLVKRTDSTSDWLYFDTLRGIVSGNESVFPMNANTGGNPIFNVDYIDPLSTGFTITSSAPASLNASGGSYIFLAIA